MLAALAGLKNDFFHNREAVKVGRAIVRAGFDRPKVFYGLIRVPGLDEKTHGGLVKAQSMQDRFPNAYPEANLMYLISSALPPGVLRLIEQARAKRIPVILNQNGVAYAGWHGPGWEKTNRLLRDVLQSSDYVIYQSEFCKMAADRFLGESSAPNCILHNPVELDRYQTRASALEHPPFVLLTSGSHHQFYRIESSLRVLAELRSRGVPALLTIAGRYCWAQSQEAGERDIQKVVEQLDLGSFVTQIGPYPQSEAASIFQSAHLLLHTKYNDPCPRLVVEALACGLPVVYSRSGGTPELVGDDAGIGIDAALDWDALHPPDSRALADAVQQVIESYETFRASARARAEQHLGLEGWLDHHEEIFKKVLG